MVKWESLKALEISNQKVQSFENCWPSTFQIYEGLWELWKQKHSVSQTFIEYLLCAEDCEENWERHEAEKDLVSDF